MKISQRNLNRSKFVMWEMKRNVSVVHIIVATRSSGPPTSQPVSCLTRFSAAVICLRVFVLFCLPKQTTNHRRLESKPPKKFRQWQRTYWQGLSKVWCAGFNLVWTQMVATSSRLWCRHISYTMRSASNFVAISSLVVKLLKKCWVR